GTAFFDRFEESKRLKNNILHGRHTLLLAPRRFGKTSLARHVIKHLDISKTELDLFLLLDAKAAGAKLLEGVKALINQLTINNPEKWFRYLNDYFLQSKKRWVVGFKGVRLEIIPEHKENVIDNILEGLNALEYLLVKKKQRAVFFIDEFQEIAKLEESRALEGVIRHFAQSSSHLSFIFSGSDWHMLAHMFEDEERPLYRLCDRINLGKIPENYYRDYLNAIAKKTWKRQMSDDVFKEIMNLSDRYPYYVNAICVYLWDNFPNKQPKVAQVQECWLRYIKDLLKETRTTLSTLTLSQLKVLILVSQGMTELSGKEAILILNLSSSAVLKILRQLEVMDYVEKSDSKKIVYEVVNPVVKYSLKMFYQNYLE
ncbi:MAG: hypothetical protein KAT71_04420, partial [Gammaproteobacteria bacterium]|nr:hypothetical protein [Gammaproteobacteria bacterium]